VLLGAVIATMGAAASAASCQLVAGLDGDFTQAPDGGADAEADAGAPLCQPATYPDPPGGTDDGNDVGTIVVAMHNIDLGDMMTTPGYDLDHTCTCTGDAGPTCVGTGSATSYCDGPGGIDNATGKLLTILATPLGGTLGSQAFTKKINEGLWSVIIKIEGYNGEKDDPEVVVTMYATPGLGAAPNWNGNDSWPILDTSFDANMMPRYRSTGAYVNDHVLVSAAPSVPLTFAGTQSTITINVTGLVATGTIAKVNGGYRLVNATLAGRWALSDVFASVSSYRDDNGLPLCTDKMPTYSVLKGLVCADADITVDSMAPKTAPCDALSFGMSFNADPVIFGPIVAAPAPSPGCPMATDPALDSCSK
jgi:hypothetical protein